jgi:hypothetical protein
MKFGELFFEFFLTEGKGLIQTIQAKILKPHESVPLCLDQQSRRLCSNGHGLKNAFGPGA